MSRVVLQISLVGVGPAPALGPQRFLQYPVLLHLGQKIVLSHLGQNVGEEGGEEVGVDLCILRVEGVQVFAQG